MNMKHTYKITGMTCNGCKNHVEKTLSHVKGVSHVSVDLENGEATIEMQSHIPIDHFKEALEKDGGSYQIHNVGEAPIPLKKQRTKGQGTGTFYCPMRCEGEKTYDKPGDCPVCGMDLVEEQSSASHNKEWTCPMHPEVIKDEPGSCPICGMDLVPKEPDLTAEEKSYRKLLRKFWLALGFTLPIFLIAMSD